MIIQKSFYYADLVLKKHILFLSVENSCNDSYFIIINVFTVTFDQFKASLLNEINFL